jgi:hypothetical protein
MKINPLIIVIFWILWVVGLDYISEYVISRPTDGSVQFLSLIFVLAMTVLLVKKTYLYIINNLNK